MSGKKWIFYFWSAIAIAVSSCSGDLPANLGQFAPCPDKPNCVSTQANDEEHAIPSIAYSGSSQEAKTRLEKIIHSLPRTRVVVDKDDFIHVEFTSKIFRFVDDVEFYLAKEEGKIHFRSASRVGRSDLGVNRKRMEEISSRFSSPEQ